MSWTANANADVIVDLLHEPLAFDFPEWEEVDLPNLEIDPTDFLLDLNFDFLDEVLIFDFMDEILDLGDLGWWTEEAV